MQCQATTKWGNTMGSVGVAGIAARWVHDLAWTDVPASVQEATVRAVVQSVAGGVGGVGLPEPEVAMGIARAEAETGRCTVFGYGTKAPVATAIFVNSVLFCALEQQEMHVSSGTHPLEVIVPVALNLAELTSATGVQLLEAVLAGTEVAIALGIAGMEATPFGGAQGLDTAFVPSVYGAVGAAATASRLLGLDVDRTAGAMCQAANLAAGLSECIKAGSTEYHYGLGDASRIGYLAARLSQAGAEWTPTTFEGPAGFFHRFAELDAQQLAGADLVARIERRLGHTWGMPENIFKRYPVHFPNLAYIDAAKTLRARHAIDPADIELIELTLNQWCELNHGGNLGPYTKREDTRAATAYSVAGMLTRGHYDIDDADRYDAPDLLALVAKTKIGHFDDPRLADDWTSVRVAVRAKGRTYVYDSQDEGIPDYRLPMDEVCALGTAALARALGPENARLAVAQLVSIDQTNDLGPLLSLLGGPAATGSH